jgi:spore maturation protein B
MEEGDGVETFIRIISTYSVWSVPIILGVTLFHGFIKGVSIYDVFVEGAKEGFNLAIRLVPYIIGIYVAIGVFRESGALYLMINLIKPVLSIFNVPGEVIPLMIVRPISGPAALALSVDLFDAHGPDSLIGRMASTIQGSTDTTLYILAIYFASVEIKNARYAIPVGLMADVIGFLAAVYVCNIFFG